jgi:hypothetical protein
VLKGAKPADLPIQQPTSSSWQLTGKLPEASACAADQTEEIFPMRSDIVPGAIFPDYELSDHAAKRRKLSELQG